MSEGGKTKSILLEEGSGPMLEGGKPRRTGQTRVDERKDGRIDLPQDGVMKTVSIERMDRIHLGMDPPRDR